MDYIIEQLKSLMAIPSPTGFTTRASKYVMDELRAMGYEPQLTNKGGVLVDIGGEGDPLILSAHLDTLGGMVAEIKSNGRLRLLPLGGLNPNNAEAENCIVHSRLTDKEFEGTFQMNDPSVHVNREYSTQKREFSAMEVVLDEKAFSKDETIALGISVGDVVSFDPRTVITKQGYIKSRFLDDKLSVSILLGYAKYLKDENLVPKRKVYLYITVYEEVGHGCCGAIPSDVVEIVSVDMGCIGIGLNCTEHQVSICAKDSGGPYNYDVTTNLIKAAKRHELDFAVDLYPSYGSDADAALSAGYEVKHGLIGAGVYASHGYERSHIDGVKNTFELIKAYTLD